MWRILSGLVRRFWAVPASLYLVLLVLCTLFFSYHIGKNPADLGSKEMIASAQTRSIKQIWNNPLNGPYKIVVFSIKKTGISSKIAVRLSSAVFGIIFAFCFYFLVKSWFGRFIGLLGAAILSTTPLFFILARTGSGEIMLASIVAVMAAYMWLVRTQNHTNAAYISLAAVSVLFMYVPGTILWTAGAAIICRKKIMEALSDIPVTISIFTGLAGLVVISPLILGLVRDTTLIKPLFLVPSHFPNIFDLLKNFGWMLSALFVKSPDQNGILLGRLPVLSIIETALFTFGAYALLTSASKKALSLAATVFFGVIYAAVNNNLALLIISLPAVCIFVTAGLRYLFIEWRSVFPLNPVAKALSFTLLAAVVTVNIFYGLKYTLEDWPHSVPKSYHRMLK